MKKIIEACIDRILEFDTQEEAAEYLEALRNKKTEFRIVNREEVGGKYRVRIQEQYNKSPMIEN